MNCEICGKELEEWEEDEGICEDCQASIVINEDIEPTFEEF